MRIAQVAPLYESVPPKAYGGTERVVSYLTDELVALRHDVTLFASGDSETRARLVSTCPEGLRLAQQTCDPLAAHYCLLEELAREAHSFDIIHFHLDYLHFPLSRRAQWRHVTTLHGRLDVPGLRRLYDEYGEMPVVSISDAQRTPLAGAHWRGTVYHGLPPDALEFRDRPDGYLAFLGRISPEKRVDRAIEIAARVGLPLRIAAKIDDADRKYFEREVAHLFELPHVEYIGEIADGDKSEFLGRASALLFPIDWPEPFGLVVIEALACGTPVIAWPNGSVPELITNGVTGAIVTSIDEAVDAMPKVLALDRRECRRVFDRRFTVRRMAQDYLAVYDALLSQAGAPTPVMPAFEVS